MKTLLITGFDPFGGQHVNPSWEAVQQLPDRIGEYVLCKLEIPTVFGVAAQTVLDAAARCHPDVILCIGQAAGRSDVTPERIAVNIRDARIADNAGNQPDGIPIIENSPAAYLSTLPVKDMAKAIRDAQIPACVSNSAGTFVCNDTLYTLLHHFHGSATRVGFLHVPNLPDQGTPSLPLDAVVTALTAAISAL